MNLKQWQRSKKIKAEAEAAAKRTVERVLNAVKEPAMGEFKEYKAGEKIVYHSLPYSRLFYVKAELDDSIVVRECWDEAGAKCFSEFPPYADIRHATPEEIAAGHRIDNDLGDDSHIENHISPNCKVEDV
ncbi:hypothetical protein [Acinetobacter baumannii]|uniref:hypothetical protein n=1 Tax=Acinetobacter baumannii TaxID=470 RepID=UPI00396F3C1D